MNAKAIVMGTTIFLVGFGFYTGFFPNETYSFWLAEAVANGTIFMVLGAIFILAGLLGRR